MQQQLKIQQDGQVWVVRLQRNENELAEYRYSSEAQARYFAAIFEMGPTQLPPPQIRAKRSKRRRRVVAA
ncbi:MAG: hypothetical protein ACT4TC_00995 [Myxococcaceae bacterium]